VRHFQGSPIPVSFELFDARVLDSEVAADDQRLGDEVGVVFAIGLGLQPSLTII
jgi:hypothetical protein